METNTYICIMNDDSQYENHLKVIKELECNFSYYEGTKIFILNCTCSQYETLKSYGFKIIKDFNMQMVI